MKKYILSLDQGTTSSRAVLFDRNAKVLSISQNEFTQIYPQPGWVEHDPTELLLSQYQAIAGATRAVEGSEEEIAAIGITNQRETTVVWNRETGAPIYNAIVWQCRRTASRCEALAKQNLAGYIKDHTGLVIDAYFAGTKISWILDHVDGARALAGEGKLLFGTIETWLIWNLTGGRVHVTDYTNASRTMLFDVDRLEWDPFLCEKLGIPMNMLPEVRPSSCVYGECTENLPGLGFLKGVPIAGAAGDQSAALFGQGCMHEGAAKNTYGTGCFLLMNTGEKRVRSESNLLSTIAWGVNGKVDYALEGSVFNAGSAIKWLRDELGIVSTAHECDLLAESIDSTGGVYCVPAFTGLGAPYWDMYARGCIVGLTRGSGRAQIVRSVLESIAYQVADLLRAMNQDSGLPLHELKVDGGASVSNILMQFQANLLGVCVNRPKVVETSALGAAFLAGLAIGFWNFEEISGCREVDRIFKPATDRTAVEKCYAGWHRAVKRAQGWAVPAGR
jgi:glycerol kinase